MAVVKEFAEVLRDAPDGARDNPLDVFRTPAWTVALTAPLTGLELGGAAVTGRGRSPALSTNVFLLGAGSGTTRSSTHLSGAGDERVLRPETLCFMAFGGGIIWVARALLSEALISRSPLPGVAGMRLGGRNCDTRIACKNVSPATDEHGGVKRGGTLFSPLKAMVSLFSVAVMEQEEMRSHSMHTRRADNLARAIIGVSLGLSD